MIDLSNINEFQAVLESLKGTEKDKTFERNWMIIFGVLLLICTLVVIHIVNQRNKAY